MSRNLKHVTATFIKHATVLALSLIIAVIARKYILVPLGIGTRIVWVTFYPVVIIAALFSGLLTGIFAAVMSCWIAVYAWQVISTQPFINDHGDWIGLGAFLVNCVMISAVGEVARRSRNSDIKARDEAVAANKAKSVFLANMSHELRTPLNAILGFSGLFQNDAALTDEQRQAMAIINRSGNHLLNLINNVLDMAKIESGRIMIENRPMDLKPVILEIIDLMHQRAEVKGLRLSQDLPSGSLVILADISKLRQIIINLVGNAIAYTSHGGVVLRVRRITEQNGSKENRIIIEVADSGDGITPEDQKRVFDPFVQIGDRPDRKGTGLGLTITRQFTELMGGRIDVVSSLGKGSVFRVDIPVEFCDDHVFEDVVTHDWSSIRIAPGQPDYRILIVDDNPDNWILLRHFLEKTGFNVRVALNGAEGIEAFKSFQPHFIWMDWRMPVMDGMEATRRIRELENGRNVKIVALSASVFKEDRERVLSAGVDDFIAIPIDFDQLIECIEAHLGVGFISEVKNIEKDSVMRIDKDILAGIPVGIKKELSDALISLDAEKIASVMPRVFDVDPEIGKILEEHTKQFRYTTILRALREDMPV